MGKGFIGSAVAVALIALALVAVRDSGRSSSCRQQALGPLLASWQTVGGCGAGASSGTGAGVKWIGRNVTGGLVHVEMQGNYIKTTYGYNYVGTSLVTRDVTEKWNLGVAVPYLYKYMHHYAGLAFNVANQGIGDIDFLLTRRLGAINDYILTLSVGAPTGTYRAHLLRTDREIIPQDRQLGAGKVTGSLMLDHVIDNIWGPTVIGGLASWRGGENSEHNYRAPNATLYAYSSYLLGPFAPALGLQVTGATTHDRDQAMGDQATALFSVAANASLEWSTDWIAVLVGASLPYQYDALTKDNMDRPHYWSFGAWIVGLGIAVSPF